MFQVPRHKQTGLSAFFAMLAVIYHSIVRKARGDHHNAVVSLLLVVSQKVVMVLAFVIMFEMLGFERSLIRGDFIIFIMSGIFLYMVHIQTFSSVLGAATAADGTLLHTPLNTIVEIVSGALSMLYTQTLSMCVILFVYHCVFAPITIEDPILFYVAFLGAWLSGAGVGMVIRAIKPWLPDFVSIFRMVYMRASIVTSGKMFVANTLPLAILPLFTWNPLFHSIDQARNAAFINYTSHVTSISYPFYVSLGLITLGLMGDFYGRKNLSRSFSARR